MCTEPISSNRFVEAKLADLKAYIRPFVGLYEFEINRCGTALDKNCNKTTSSPVHVCAPVCTSDVRDNCPYPRFASSQATPHSASIKIGLQLLKTSCSSARLPDVTKGKCNLGKTTRGKSFQLMQFRAMPSQRPASLLSNYHLETYNYACLQQESLMKLSHSRSLLFDAVQIHYTGNK
jgi:hypothetical protein